jgi:DNA-binding transcriptional regulator LsrR (DeoR family)
MGKITWGLKKIHSDELVGHIKWLHDNQGLSGGQIAKMYGISEMTVRGYLNGRTRSTVPAVRSIHLSIDKS